MPCTCHAPGEELFGIPMISTESSFWIERDPDQLAAIRRDLTLHPAIALADTLEAIQTANAWIEQETLIDKIGAID